jgi:hypothetical protein
VVAAAERGGGGEAVRRGRVGVDQRAVDANSTLVTAVSSLAVADTTKPAVTVAPFDGAVISTSAARCRSTVTSRRTPS